MVTTPFSLCIFVADGDPDGLRIVDRFNASARAVVFPRALLPQVKSRPELQQTGVYLLLGPQPDGEGELLYVGEGDPILPRLQKHQSEKDFWTRAIGFVAVGGLLNKAHVQFLEARLLQGGVRECRNKSLQLMFQLMGGGDKAGSGMDKIRAGWRSQHWRSPRLKESLQPDRVKLVLPMVSLIPDEVEKALRQRFGDRITKLDKTAVQAVVTAQVEGSVTNGRMQEITGEHAKDITGVLQSLVRDGLLTQQNQRRWASYRVAEDSPQSDSDSPQVAGDSPQDSPQWAGDSPHLAGSSPHLAGDSPHLPPELLSLAGPARNKKKVPVAEMEGLVLLLCEARWLTSKELAALLSRDPENLQSRILGGMVKKHLLELRFPDVPNRPDQAYRTVAKPPQ